MKKRFFPAILLYFLGSISFLATAGSSFKVEVIGKGEPMILIPGLASSGEVWKSTVEHYKSHYRCHVLTLAGFAGVPPLPDEHAMLDTFKKDIIAYIRENHLDRPVIVGHSLGGFLALWIASSEPDLVGKTVVVDALPFLPAVFYPTMTSQTAMPFAIKTRQQMLAMSDSQFIATQKIAFRMLVTDTTLADQASKWGIASDKGAVAEAVFEMRTTDLRSQISKIASPVLVFATWIAYAPNQTHDGITEIFKDQYAQLKNYNLIVEDKARHFVMLDDPEGFFAATDRFLAAKNN